MKCCGVNELQDWDQNLTLNMTSSVPDPCCKTPTENCGVGKLDDDDKNDIYEKGCSNLINLFFIFHRTRQARISLIMHLIFSFSFFL